MSRFSRQKIEQIRRVFKQTNGDENATARICDVDVRSVREYAEADNVQASTTTNAANMPFTSASSNTAASPTGPAAQGPTSEPARIEAIASVPSNTRTREELEAQAFVLFEQGVKPEQVLIQLKAPSQLIQKFYESYLKMKGQSELVELYHKLGPGLDANRQLAADMKARNMKANEYVRYLEHLPEFVSHRGEIALILKSKDEARRITAEQIELYAKEEEEHNKRTQKAKEESDKAALAQKEITTKLNATNDELKKAQHQLTFIKSEEYPRVLQARTQEIMENDRWLIEFAAESVFLAMANDQETSMMIVDLMNGRQIRPMLLPQDAKEEWKKRVKANSYKIYLDICTEVRNFSLAKSGHYL